MTPKLRESTDNYIKLLPKQPAAQSYREVLTQEANLVAAAQQQKQQQ